MTIFNRITPTAAEQAMQLPGDDKLDDSAVTIDSGFDLPQPPGQVYPWFVQLGKDRAGWYFTKFTEKFFFPSARGIRYIDAKWQGLQVGDRIPDYGKDGYFDCFYLDQDHVIGYESARGTMRMTWVLTFWPAESGTRVIIRLRLSGLKKGGRAFMTFGKLIDRLTISWLAAGLRERCKPA